MPDLTEELPKDFYEAVQDAFESYQAVEWMIPQGDEYAYKVGFLHGAVWLNRHKQFDK